MRALGESSIAAATAIAAVVVGGGRGTVCRGAAVGDGVGAGRRGAGGAARAAVGATGGRVHDRGADGAEHGGVADQGAGREPAARGGVDERAPDVCGDWRGEDGAAAERPSHTRRRRSGSRLSVRSFFRSVFIRLPTSSSPLARDLPAAEPDWLPAVQGAPQPPLGCVQ